MTQSTFPAGYGYHQFLIKYHIFCQKSWEVIKTLKVSFGKCDMSINSRFWDFCQKSPEVARNLEARLISRGISLWNGSVISVPTFRVLWETARNRQKLPEIWRRGRFLEGFPYKTDQSSQLLKFRYFEICPDRNNSARNWETWSISRGISL